MADDWIKMRTDLYRDPKVCMMADALMDSSGDLARYVNQHKQRDMTVTRNVMRNVTVGALVSVWGVLRHRGKRVDDDLVVKSCALEVVDDLADLPGFGEAMASVGWIAEGEDCLVLPGFFEEFNVDPALEAKQKNAQRQRRFREKHSNESNVTRNVTHNVTVTDKSNTEKRREEKRTPIVPEGFESFIAKYPKLRINSRRKALEIWHRAKLEPIAATIVAHVEQLASTPGWQREGGKFVPNVTTYLNDARWETPLPLATEAPRRLAV